jgi:hypothetical protein
LLAKQGACDTDVQRVRDERDSYSVRALFEVLNDSTIAGLRILRKFFNRDRFERMRKLPLDGGSGPGCRGLWLETTIVGCGDEYCNRRQGEANHEGPLVGQTGFIELANYRVTGSNSLAPNRGHVYKSLSAHRPQRMA